DPAEDVGGGRRLARERLTHGAILRGNGDGRLALCYPTVFEMVSSAPMSTPRIVAFVVGMTVGATLSVRKPICNRRGTHASRPANSPQSVTDRCFASARIIRNSRRI